MTQRPEAPVALEDVALEDVALEQAYQHYLDGLLTNDGPRCRASFERWLDATPDVRALYEGLVQRALYKVGDLWERGQISVATEHLATAVSESLLNLTYPRLFARPRVGKSVVVASTANEYHQLGAKMVADVFEWHGWRAHFLGANTPPRDLLALVRDKNPDAVALSLTVYFNLEALLHTAAAVRAEFPSVPMIVGGQAFRWGGAGRAEQIAGVRCVTSLADLESWILASARHAC